VRVALDTNILAYAEGVNGDSMKRTALELVQNLPEGAVLLPVQTLGELFNLLVRKTGRAPAKARVRFSVGRTPIPDRDFRRSDVRRSGSGNRRSSQNPSQDAIHALIEHLISMWGGGVTRWFSCSPVPSGIAFHQPGRRAARRPQARSTQAARYHLRSLYPNR